MPAVIGVIGILLISLVFRLEPIAYCIMMGFEEQGKKHLAKIYSKKDPDGQDSLE